MIDTEGEGKDMPKISFEPHDAPRIELYKYFYDRLHNKVIYRDKVVPFAFSRKTSEIVHPCIYLSFIRRRAYDSDRYIGDDVVALNTETGMYEKITIGEPDETFWGVVVESKTRDEMYAIEHRVLMIMRRMGKVDTPFYIEHSRSPQNDLEGDNTLIKTDAESLVFMKQLGYRMYMRLPSGIPIPEYTARPPIEEILLELGVDNNPVEEVVINAELETP